MKMISAYSELMIFLPLLLFVLFDIGRSLWYYYLSRRYTPEDMVVLFTKIKELVTFDVPNVGATGAGINAYILLAEAHKYETYKPRKIDLYLFCSFVRHFNKKIDTGTPNQSLWLMMYKNRLEDMPLYMASEDLCTSIIAAWRLQIGK